VSSIRPHRRASWWRRALQRTLQLAAMACVVMAALLLVGPGLASDYGITHFRMPSAPEWPLPRKPKRIFPAGTFSPHFSALQLTVVKMWDDVKVSTPDLAPVQNDIEQVFVSLTDDSPPGPPGSEPRVVKTIFLWLPLGPYCRHHDCRIHHCHDHDGDK